ncbi:MAG: ribokinase [Micavibrio aeruginosavorus]|uniref:Ribokinase n=1 Tax=Micavibrio aeruginosavorus TaxID=349221 RepID=A0A2W4ZMY3_9BACT|nr:MAG: ribokinase [Micavibrio aeruginosavorus]
MIVVFGSINMDVHMRLQAFPKAGETVLSPAYEMSPGGKGANQALACARSGAKTAIVGKIGDDAAGQKILGNLRRNEVMTSGAGISDDLPTGMAFVMTDKSGENQIIVASGANAEVKSEQVPNEILNANAIVLMQMEVPVAETLELAHRAKKQGARVILNLAPAAAIPVAALQDIDYVVVNEGEAEVLAEAIGAARGGNPLETARAIALKGGTNCIVTLGAKGAAVLLKEGGGFYVPAMALENVVDTTGAGDCFCGTLAASLYAKQDIASALRRASVAGSLACTKNGAQDSFPFSDEIETALKSFPQTQAL